MAFSISSVTDAGRTAMQIALDNDYPLIFTALRSGNGSYTEGEDVTSRTALKSLKNSFSIGSREDLEHSVKLGAVLTNYDGTSTIVSESYNVNEIGLFCTVNNIEYLYALAAAPDDSGRELPAYDGTNLTQIVQTWTVALTNDAEIQVEMSGAYALAADLTTEIANRKVADSKDNTVTYTSADDVSIFNSGDLGGDSDYAWAPVAKIDSAEKHSVLFNKVSTMFKNIRTIAKMIGTTDISAVGDGTVSGAVSKISSDLSEFTSEDVSAYSLTWAGNYQSKQYRFNKVGNMLELSIDVYNANVFPAGHNKVANLNFSVSSYIIAIFITNNGNNTTTTACYGYINKNNEVDIVFPTQSVGFQYVTGLKFWIPISDITMN